MSLKLWRSTSGPAHLALIKAFLAPLLHSGWAGRRSQSLADVVYSGPSRMAELRRSDGSSTRLLLNQHLIGRGAECALRLSGAYVSAQHALIRWYDRAWELLDRG